eukprot:1366102-Amorphochlora_amoeboformis.AAC.1
MYISKELVVSVDGLAAKRRYNGSRRHGRLGLHVLHALHAQVTHLVVVAAMALVSVHVREDAVFAGEALAALQALERPHTRMDLTHT